MVILKAVRSPFFTLVLFVQLLGATGIGQESHRVPSQRAFMTPSYLNKHEGLASLMSRHHCSRTQLAQVMDDNEITPDELSHLWHTKPIKLFVGCDARADSVITARSIKIFADENARLALLRHGVRPTSRIAPTVAKTPEAPSTLVVSIQHNVPAQTRTKSEWRLFFSSDAVFLVFDGAIIGVIAMGMIQWFFAGRRRKGKWVNCGGVNRFFRVSCEKTFECRCGENHLYEKNLQSHWMNSSRHIKDWITTGPREPFFRRWFWWIPWPASRNPSEG